MQRNQPIYSKSCLWYVASPSEAALCEDLKPPEGARAAALAARLLALWRRKSGRGGENGGGELRVTQVLVHVSIYLGAILGTFF